VSGVTVTVGRQPCSTCNSSGLVIHPQWEQFWRENATVPERGDTGKRSLAYFRALGFETPPPEEIVCDTCDGRGHTGTDRPLDDVIQNLYDLNESLCSRVQALEEQLAGN